MKTQAKRFSSFLLILLSLLICCAATSSQPATQPTSQPSTAPTPQQLEQASNVFRQLQPLTDADKARIEKLIAQLGSSKWKDREEATKALNTDLFAALPLILQAADGKDPEIAARTRRVVSDMKSQYSDIAWTLRGAIATRQAAKDTTVVGDLILLMEDDNFAVRSTAQSGLSRLTGHDFGYLPDAKPAQRRQTAQKAQEWWEKKKTIFVMKGVTAPDAIALDLGGGVQLRLVLIPAGKFLMGSPKDEKDREVNESPQHEVTIASPFYMGVYTVTLEQWEQVVGENPSYQKYPQKPVVMVSLYDAMVFCNKLSQKTGKTVRLPSEAEWEYACRAGSTASFSYGDDASKLGDYAWYHNNDDGGVHVVGQKRPNTWGLYDMHGNVFQWCSDWCTDSYATTHPDSTAYNNGPARIIRGGCWEVLAKNCRSAFRARGSPATGEIGFRVVVDVK
jgi:formylglycine-generating enzyme required for sulfatase activity/Spy/CpxP family protein refolding chaperone